MLVASVALAAGLLAGPAMAQEFYVSGLTVEKAVQGEDAPEGAEFAFALACDDEFGQEFTLADAESETFEGLSQGATCTLTETVPDGADYDSDDFVTLEPSVDSLEGDTDESWDADTRTLTFTVPDTPETAEPHISVVFTNDFGDGGVLGSGDLVVTKRVSGDAEGPWEFDVDCPGSVQDTVTLGDGDSETFTVTRGPETTCTITELDPDGFDVAHKVDDGEETAGAEASFVFDDGSVDADVHLIREVDFTNTPEDEPKEDETAVLADTGFEVTWGLVLAAGLLVPGAGVLVYARKRDRREA